MPDYFALLQPKARRGSKARCHLLTLGSPEEVAKRLTKLTEPRGRVEPKDHWMPNGFTDSKEANWERQLDF